MKLFMLYIPTEDMISFLLNVANGRTDIDTILNKADCMVASEEWINFNFSDDRKHDYFPLIMKWMPAAEAYALVHAFKAITKGDLLDKKLAFLEIKEVLGELEYED